MNVEQRQFLGYAKVIADGKPISQIHELKNLSYGSEYYMEEELYGFKIEWRTKYLNKKCSWI